MECLVLFLDMSENKAYRTWSGSIFHGKGPSLNPLPQDAVNTLIDTSHTHTDDETHMVPESHHYFSRAVRLHSCLVLTGLISRRTQKSR